MRGTRMTVLAALTLMAVSVGCQNKIADERDALYKQSREQGAQNAQLAAENAQLKAQLQSAPNPADLQQMKSEIDKRDAEIARLNQQLQAPIPGQPADPGLAGIETTYDKNAGTVTVNIPGEVLFPSGQEVLKSSAYPKLDQIVAAIKKDYPGKPIFVDGHTDSDPINRTKAKFDDNYELSYARAAAVRKYIVGKGIDDKTVAIRAFGPNKPKATKDKSRRVEIVVAVK